MNEAELAAVEADVLDRFLRYVRIDTQSRHEATDFPSTPGQLDLLRLLRDELAALGCAEVTLDEHGYVMATVPATLPPGNPAPPVVAFFAHVDTSEDAPGAGVEPQVWRQYDGRDLALPGDPTQVLQPAEDAPLRAAIGHDLVTSDGRTLLGADDKAGVAAIMAAVAYLLRHPEIPHGRLRICFNPDEEVGRGMNHIDLAVLGADYAYTLDASDAGEVQNETFSADGANVTFYGRGIHPGWAKGILVNALKVAADFLAALPRDGLSPETTAEREGFVHPVSMSGNAEEARIRFIVRDFDTEKLVEKEDLLRRLAEAAVARHPEARYEIEVVEQYRNMREVLDRHPQVVALADEAVRRVGLTPLRRPIRGGTDGSRLSAMGLPTPNLFTGGHNAHSRKEWASVQDMGKAAWMVVELAQLWGEQPAAS
jgi:tripeptide aminopeptidase